MGTLINLIGHTFGKLKVIKRVSNNSYNKPRWLCLCDCGNTCIVSGNGLRIGHTKSCGCLHKETVSKKLTKNLKNKRFGRLVVLRRSGSSEDWRALWLCKCDCGNEIITKGKYLLCGDTKSCGCLNSDNTIARNVANKIKRTIKICPVCGIEFEVIPSTDKIHCSIQCAGVSKRGLSPDSSWRDGYEYLNWKVLVYEKDNYVCGLCGKHQRIMHAHHMKSACSYPEYKYNADNGIVLCEECHKFIHSKFGFTGDSTKYILKNKFEKGYTNVV